MRKKYMNITTKHYDVGVLVGRFQVSELTEGHKILLDTVIAEHEKIIIFLGLSPCKTTFNNPLDFEARKQMLLAALKDHEKTHEISIMYIKDCYSDTVWSKNLDKMIQDLIGPNTSVVLYGGRDSFISCYNGIFPACELKQTAFYSGTEQRKEISKKVKGSADFRAGVIWATTNQYSNAIPTVDIAIFNENYTQLLLARKEGEDKYRFVGGFVSGKTGLEEDAKREVMEETHLEIGDLRYIGSCIVDDWRYRNEKQKIITTLFSAKLVFGRPTPDDDIEELRWFDVKDLQNKINEKIIDPHKPLVNKLFEAVILNQEK